MVASEQSGHEREAGSERRNPTDGDIGGLFGAARQAIAYRESGVALALLIFCAVMWISSPPFRTQYNVSVILLQMSVVSILAFGQTLAIISGAFDLSQGAVAGLAGNGAALLWRNAHLPPDLALACGLLIGVGCGLANGVLAAVFGLHPIVMTLATGTLITGLVFFFTQGLPVLNLPESMLFLGGGSIGPVPAAVATMLVVGLVMHVMLTRTLFGRRVLQIGGNRQAALSIGLDVNGVQIGVFVISGFLAALGGLVSVGRLGNASATIGQDLLFPVVTASIVGGTLLTGGSGSMLGTLMGAGIMAIVTNALVLHRVDPFLVDTVQGALVTAALLIDQFRRGAVPWANRASLGRALQPRLRRRVR
jgi:ribose transport system permease protein